MEQKNKRMTANQLKAFLIALLEAIKKSKRKEAIKLITTLIASL